MKIVYLSDDEIVFHESENHQWSSENDLTLRYNYNPPRGAIVSYAEIIVQQV